jgi:ribosomal protein L11 methyltransferase
MKVYERRARVSAVVVDRVERSLERADFDAFAIVTRADGDADLLLYPQSEETLRELEALLAPLGLVLEGEGAVPSDALIEPWLPGRPRELAEGVWVLERDEQQTPGGALRLVVPPSTAFGDGLHPTTRAAAELMLDVDFSGARVLDLGCGTGVLTALASARGASSFLLTDVEAAALDAASELCARNGVVDAQVLRADLLDGVPLDPPFDVVIANIWAELALRLFADPRLQAALPTGELVLSGIADQDLDEVRRRAADAGFRLAKEKRAAFWWAARLERES